MLRNPELGGNTLRIARLTLLAALINLTAAATASTTTAPEPGAYCPGTGILLVIAEELSASLELTMRSRAAHIDKDPVTTVNTLHSAGTTLRLAASRGAAARTALLIDAIIEAEPGEAYTQMLSWFPLLHTSLLTLPDDATVNAVNDLTGRAEDLMQAGKNGDPLKPLREARHLLTCDGLEIPLQEAMQAQIKLMKKLGPQAQAMTSDYDALLDSIRNALMYALENSER